MSIFHNPCPLWKSSLGFSDFHQLFLIIRWCRVITFSLASATESALHEEFSSVVSHCISYFLYILDGQNGQYSDFFFKVFTNFSRWMLELVYIWTEWSLSSSVITVTFLILKLFFHIYCKPWRFLLLHDVATFSLLAVIPAGNFFFFHFRYVKTLWVCSIR